MGASQYLTGATVPLTDPTIRNAKPGVHPRKGDTGGKPYKLFDGNGLYLEVAPAGGKWWRLKYRHGGKEKRLSLGVYPQTPLATPRDKTGKAVKDAITGTPIYGAREKAQSARRLLDEGIDPSQHRQAEATREAAIETDSFEAVGREWFAKNKHRWVDGHSEKIISRLERDLFPWIGTRPVAELTAPELLACLRRIEERGSLDTAHRAKQDASAIIRYAIANGRAQRDPAQDLRGALPPAKGKHFATITEPTAVAELLRACDGYSGDLVTRCALRLLPLVFVRPGELRHAEWSEFDFDAGEWRIPGARMKMRVLHIVPLSAQAVAVLRELHPLTGEGRYVFPSVRTKARPISENTINAALRRMGYSKDQMTGHGFRATASTMLNEQGWKPDAIERQLAHAERDSSRASYNHAQFLPERRKMMQAWSDYLDGIKRGNVVAGKFGRAA